MKQLFIDYVESPVGRILLVSDGSKVCALDYEDYEARMRGLLARRFGEVGLERVDNAGGFSGRVRAYFENGAGLEDVPVDGGGTDFQRRVWRALREIPCGETWTYGELARHIGQPAAARAVGHANSLNPVAIIVPCHRVVGTSGDLTGYAGGLERKQWLLEHERRRSSRACVGG